MLEAAGTKWNFLPFRPGLVGGHCIGVDPYYLTHKAQQIGYHPEMILAGRRINDNMALYVAGEVVRLMTAKRIHVKASRVLVLGLAFKENCPDLRNTKVARPRRGAASSTARRWTCGIPGSSAARGAGTSTASASCEAPARGRYDAIVLAVGAPRVRRDAAGGHPPAREAQARALRRQVPVRAASRPTAGSDASPRHRRGGLHRLPRRASACSSAATRSIGLDNLNAYYDPTLKQARLARLQAHQGLPLRAASTSPTAPAMEALFANGAIRRVVHLAAQAGVRYSVENPHAYVDSNVTGSLHVLEGCRHHGVEHLVFASTSSVYGANTKMPFSVHQNVDHPLSLYAATKKANELMAHSYASLYGLPVTGLRFFTVYGPWGRPDMALFLFTRNILAGEPIDVFNYGKHRRDFTYVDDIADGVVAALDHVAAPIRTGTATIPIPPRAARRTGSTTSATTGRSS